MLQRVKLTLLAFPTHSFVGVARSTVSIGGVSPCSFPCPYSPSLCLFPFFVVVAVVVVVVVATDKKKPLSEQRCLANTTTLTWYYVG